MDSTGTLGRFAVIGGSTFRLTLHISHPDVPATEISEVFGLPVRFSHSKNEQRKTKSGERLDGNYERTNVSFSLHDDPLNFDVVSVDLLMKTQLESLDMNYILSLVETGGSCNFLLGIFSCENVMFELSNRTIDLLSDAKISIKYDFYGGE
jgi:hypothetical protein